LPDLLNFPGFINYFLNEFENINLQYFCVINAV